MDAAVYIDRMEKAVAKANVSLIKLREENATLKQRNTALEDRVNELENLVKFKNNPLESQSKSNDNCEMYVFVCMFRFTFPLFLTCAVN